MFRILFSFFFFLALFLGFVEFYRLFSFAALFSVLDIFLHHLDRAGGYGSNGSGPQGSCSDDFFQKMISPSITNEEGNVEANNMENGEEL